MPRNGAPASYHLSPSLDVRLNLTYLVENKGSAVRQPVTNKALRRQTRGLLQTGTVIGNA